ncbi:hypothetical protein GF402_11790 [Candidatus Fermentibacteria bacterium]|nr:hypothetical protein [Candidatus Fermentibacteria bacterium]
MNLKARLVPAFALSAVLVAMACGPAPREPLSSRDAVPEGAIFVLAITDPSALLENVDGYVSEGVEVLGEGFLKTVVLGALSCDSLAAVGDAYGIDPSGTVVAFMENMAPQSIGMAIPLADEEAFWATLEELGMPLAEGDPIGELQTRSVSYPGGKLFIAVDGGLAMAAGSRASISSMVARLDGDEPSAALPELSPGSIYMFTDFATFGPMAASQMAMARQQVIAEVDAGTMDQENFEAVMNLYFDAFDVFLRECSTVETTLGTAGGEITVESRIVFREGSQMAGLLTPVEVVDDLTAEIPSGDVAMGRASIDPELALHLTEAVYSAFDIELGEEFTELISVFSTNSAFSMMSDDGRSFMHMVAVYEVPGDMTVAGFGEMMQPALDFARSFLDAFPGMEISPLERVEYQGREYLRYGQTMDLASMTPATADSEAVNLPEQMSFVFWMTVEDGYLYMENASEPAVVDRFLSGVWEGETVQSSPVFDLPADAELACTFNVPEYVMSIMRMTGQEEEVGVLIADLELWVDFYTDVQSGGVVVSSMSVDGVKLAEMIGLGVMQYQAMTEGQ